MELHPAESLPHPELIFSASREIGVKTEERDYPVRVALIGGPDKIVGLMEAGTLIRIVHGKDNGLLHSQNIQARYHLFGA